MRIEEADPKGLVRESYAIEGITDGECRSIFMDWALSLPAGADAADPLRSLIATYGPENPAHPMTAILTAALVPAASPRRRGGRTARVADAR
ncbi:MAG: hypothetical protein QM656_01880 [Paracoccaceae bacterium]